MKILIINGPNLNLLGKREPEIYGSATLKDLRNLLETRFPELEFRWFQSNHEGELIDHLQEADVEGAVINPGALSHYSYSLMDCIASLSYPVIEVHISNTAAREDFRRVSVTASACRGTITGLGLTGYVLAVEALMEIPENASE